LASNFSINFSYWLGLILQDLGGFFALVGFFLLSGLFWNH
jgi:uncharacterized membrane protein YoaK (UPF0700 family)